MRRSWLVAGLLTLSTPALAERPLTYAEALNAAAESNPLLVRARYSVEGTDGSLLAAQGLFDPIFTLDGTWRQSRQQGFFQGFPFASESRTWDIRSGITGSLATGTSYVLEAGLDRNFSEFTTDFGIADQTQTQDTYTSNLGIAITQQLLEGSRLRYNMRNVTISRQYLSIAELTAERTRQDTLALAAESYWTFAYQAQLREIAAESVVVAEEALRIGRLNVEAGALAPVEETRLEAALVQAQSLLLDSESALEESANALLLVMGESPDQAIIPATAPGEAPSFELDAGEAARVAIAQNLELAVSRANLEVAELEHMNTKHGMLPSLSATGATGIGAQDTSATGALGGLAQENAFPYIQVSGNLAVPLGNRAARGDRNRAAADVLARRSELEELERSVAAQVEQQVRVLRSAQRRVELFDVNLRLAEQTLAAEEALANAGRAIQKDVLEARNEATRAAAEAVKARTDYRLAQVQLLRLQGQLPAELP